MLKVKFNKRFGVFIIGILFFLALIADIFLRIEELISSPEKEDYMIVFNPNVRADTFLLEKTTGKVWQLVTYIDLEGDPKVWKYMERIDDPKQMLDFVISQDFKKSQDRKK